MPSFTPICPSMVPKTKRRAFEGGSVGQVSGNTHNRLRRRTIVEELVRANVAHQRAGQAITTITIASTSPVQRGVHERSDLTLTEQNPVATRSHTMEPGLVIL
ncbi:hypothetical protein CCR82_06145 [Halochromatium salexigens]|uniref:Uncharacterized protein n=1 Tax=Halochromatium salexigens TaxID=49447 RepID=A0AAJ0UET1_HALSE|nr:hypothetical protein [Halochromatium salexigens]